MPGDERPVCTLFYWRDWLSDPQLRRMTPDERGRYMDVLAFTNLTPAPGILTEADVIRYAGYTEVEWPEHREAFARCFKILGGKIWVQQRCVAEAKRQKIRFKNAKKGGLKRAAARRDSHRGWFVSTSATPPLPGSRCKTLSASPGSGGEIELSALPGGSSALRAPFGDPGIFSELEARHPRVDVDVVAAKVLDAGPCQNLRNKLRNWARIADERGMDLKRPEDRLTFGKE